MKNSLFIVAIAIVVVVIAGGLWFFFAPVSPVEQTPTPYNPSQTSPPKPAPAPSSESVSIIIRSFAFEPGGATIKKGTTITWTNRDSVNHTVTSDSGGALDSPVLKQDQNFSFTFTSTGEFNYHCSIYPSMKGKVTVTE